MLQKHPSALVCFTLPKSKIPILTGSMIRYCFRAFLISAITSKLRQKMMPHSKRNFYHNRSVFCGVHSLIPFFAQFFCNTYENDKKPHKIINYHKVNFFILALNSLNNTVDMSFFLHPTFEKTEKDYIRGAFNLARSKLLALIRADKLVKFLRMAY